MYRARECLEKAGFGRRLTATPDETCLYRDFDSNGVEISGGEAQKIPLARALYRDAPFLMDEPTAASDPVSEYEVYSRFMRKRTGRLENLPVLNSRLRMRQSFDDFLISRHDGLRTMTIPYMFNRAADSGGSLPVPSLAERGMPMSTYEEFMIIQTIAGLIVAILNLKNK